MPEGHVLHRAARLQRRRFGGQTVAAESPQGRFSAGADRIDGQRLVTIDANGKHIFYRFDTDDVLHVHLGLFGKFRLQRPPYPEPSQNARLLLSTATDRLHLAGPTTCEVLSPDEVEAVVDRLGPDPILAPADGDQQMIERLGRRSIPIGAAILDQKVVAGLGNVYRSELLFLIGLHPFTRSSTVPDETVKELWRQSVEQLKQGERSGMINTVLPSEVGAPPGTKPKRAERLYAYKRHGEPCRRCGDLIRSADIDGRMIWWCPTCQPADGRELAA